MLVFATSINTMPHLHYPSLPASPSVVWRVPRNSSKSDTHTRVRHQHLHQCPCNSLEHFLALVLVSFSMNDSCKKIGYNLIFHKHGDSLAKLQSYNNMYIPVLLITLECRESLIMLRLCSVLLFIRCTMSLPFINR